MRTYTCTCAQTLYFDNTGCMNCGRGVGWCELCGLIVPVEADGGGSGTCANGHRVRACRNLTEHGVCNRYHAAGGDYCYACDLNVTVPNPAIPENREYWRRLESAKRRMLYDLNNVGVGVSKIDAGRFNAEPLRFEFKTDSVHENGRWRKMENGEQVFTGHDEGVIVINFKEADPVAREQMREQLNEPQRSLVGHFRHEVGHWFYDMLVRGAPDREAEYNRVFGDPHDPSYADALERHYDQGPPPDWADRYVSAYATMHSWEDWAETWSCYLHQAGSLDTLRAHGWAEVGPPFTDYAAALDAYARSAVAQNELARDRGQLPLVPEMLTEPVRAKLTFVHRLVSEGVRPFSN